MDRILAAPMLRPAGRGCVWLALLIMALNGMAQNESSEAVWIDVRSAAEFRSGHLENAWNIPHTEIADRITEVVSNKDAEIQLYCGSGRRSEMARETLEKLGYTRVTNAGAYRDLVKE